jgi:hypothetical protein
MLWLLGIAVNLVTTGMFYDLAMRDVEIAIGAFVLWQCHVKARIKKRVRFVGGRKSVNRFCFKTTEEGL